MMLERDFKTYSCSYYHDGAWWAIHISAYDHEDAEVRAKKLNLRLDGESVALIPIVTPGVGLLVRAVSAIANNILKKRGKRKYENRKDG